MNAIELSNHQQLEKQLWSEVVAADTERRCLPVLDAVIRYLRAFPEQTFADVEMRLRKERRYTHLIAHPLGEKAREILGQEVNKLDGDRAEYALYITTENAEKALSRRQRCQSSAQENLEKLRTATGLMGCSYQIA